MELRQLEYFVAVIEEANFTRAAARVHVAQPGVSAQIRRLEREFGHELLDRSGRTVRPTQVGEAVLPYARAALAAVEGARRTVDELAGLVRGQVAVGTITSCPPVDLPGLLAGFHRLYPGVEITLSEGNSDQLLLGLADGRLDFAVVGLAHEPPAGIGTQVVVEESLVAAVALDDPLAGRDEVTLAEVASRQVISLSKGTGLRAAFEAGCAEAGLSPRITFEGSDPDLLVALAERGLGVAILPSSVRGTNDALHVLDIVRPRLLSRLDLAWRDGGPLSPAARALVEHAKQHLAYRS